MDHNVKKTEFKFKDNRSYVHGTDIFNNLVEQILKQFKKNDQLNLKLSFKKPIHSQCIIHTSENISNIDLSNNSSAELKLKFNEFVFYYYIEEIFEPIKEKYSSYEKVIMDLAAIEDDIMTISTNKDISFIEKVVFMNKKLLSSRVKEIKKKFFFSMIEIQDLNKIFNINNVTLKLDRILGNKHFKSCIFVDSKNIGNLYFTLV